MVDGSEQPWKRRSKKPVYDFLVVDQAAAGVPADNAHDDGDDNNDDDEDYGPDLMHMFDENPNQPPDMYDSDDDDRSDRDDNDDDDEDVFVDDVADDVHEYEDDEVFYDHEDDGFQSVLDSTDYGSPMSSPPHLNRAFIANQSVHSIRTMSPASRAQLQRHFDASSSDQDSPASLQWDNLDTLTNLSNPLDTTRLYSPQEDDDTHTEPDTSAMDSSWRSSTPVRITRSMVSSGEYELTLSPVPFDRNSRLRRPIIRWQSFVPEIRDIPRTRTGSSKAATPVSRQ